MTITLGTNIPALISRNNLNTVANQLSTTFERFSTGLKINKASDDAAGLVISENMKALVGGSKQAQKNIQTAESYLKVAEEGMISIGDHFTRINDLLINMANGTNDTFSNTAAVREIVERIKEIDRLADSTNFNGKKMLDGSIGQPVFETNADGSYKLDNSGNKIPVLDSEGNQIINKIYVQLGADSTELSVIEISPALSDCHVSAFSAELPDNLNPDAYTDGTTTYYQQADGTFVDADGNAYTGDVDDLTTLFEPTNENCRAYLATIQDAIAILTTNRGLIGAYENRMESAFDAMTSRIEALEEAKSVYTDIDVAEESTNLTSQQIMQQINSAILSQANSTQSIALSLLGG